MQSLTGKMKGLAQGKLCSNASNLDKNKVSVSDRAKKIKMPPKENAGPGEPARKGLSRRGSYRSRVDISSGSSSGMNSTQGSRNNCSTTSGPPTTAGTAATPNVFVERNPKHKNANKILSSTLNRTKNISHIGHHFSDISRIDPLQNSYCKENNTKSLDDKYNNTQLYIHDCKMLQSLMLDCELEAANKERLHRAKADIYEIWSDNLRLEGQLAEKERQLENISNIDNLDKSLNFEHDLEKVTSQLSDVMENYTTLSVGLAATLDRYSMDGFTPAEDALQHADAVYRELSHTENLLHQLDECSSNATTKIVDLATVVGDLNQASSDQSNSISRYMKLSGDHESKVLTETSMSLQLLLKDR